MDDAQKEQAQDGGGMERFGIYRALVGHMADLLIVADQSGRFIWCEAVSGLIPKPASVEELQGWIHPEDWQAVHRCFFRVVHYGNKDGHRFRYQRSGEDWGWIEAIAIPVHDQGNDYIAIAMSEVTEKKREEDMLRRMAFHDPLTGLPNRRLFEERLTQSIAHAKRNGQLMAVFYLDIDDFKLINDGMGHEMGDLFLIAFGQRVKGCVREIDTFARMGGDEFTILLPIVDSAEGVEKVAKRILEAVKKGWDVAGMRFYSTVSMGIAVYPSDGADAETLLRRVDTALYEVKTSGRNGYKFYAGAIDPI